MTSELFRKLLRQRLESASDRILLRVLVSGKENRLIEFTGQALCARSIELAQKYCCASPSGVVLILLPHSPELFLLHLGLVLLGRLPAILAWPTNRVDPDKYQRNILHQLRSLPAAQLLTLPGLARNLGPGLPFEVTGCAIEDCERFDKFFKIDLNLERTEKHGVPEAARNVPNEPLFLQFSGGTTGDQKCVVVTAPMLSNQLERLSKTLRFGHEDSVVSWLPMYHDMGLIACFWLPLWNEAFSIQFDATDWLMNPGMLLDLMSTYRSTFCWLPNFAFVYLVGQKKRINSTVHLGHVRAWINCSEPVRENSFSSFIAAFSELGVRLEQCQTSYAMAENVFAVTQNSLNVAPATFSRLSLEEVSLGQTRASYTLPGDCYTSSGCRLPGTSIRIRRSDGELCGDAEAGEIEIYGESLFSGYWGTSGFKTQPFAVDGWYSTGDFGFTHQNDLFVIGRIKDIIITAGVNIFPEDIESFLNTVEGIYPGRVVAFGIDDQQQGTESLALVAEIRGDFDPSAAAGLENQIRQLVSSVFGLAPRYVRVAPERWIVKSTAGKISRSETKRKYLRESGKYP
jgi:fatty-acyl-CoA synthase